MSTTATEEHSFDQAGSSSRSSSSAAVDSSAAVHDDTDALLEELDADDGLDFAGFRERRMEELRLELARSQGAQYGAYAELTNEKEVIETSAKESRCAMHFYHRDFRRCKIMDKHLETLAPRYPGTRFIRVLVENVPWLVNKLQIKVLPCVVCFADGVMKDRIVGFEGLGNSDDFQTSVLELRLRQSGVIPAPPTSKHRVFEGKAPRIRGPAARYDEDDDDDDFA